jgi:hypothetical protein
MIIFFYFLRIHKNPGQMAGWLARRSWLNSEFMMSIHRHNIMYIVSILLAMWPSRWCCHPTDRRDTSHPLSILWTILRRIISSVKRQALASCCVPSRGRPESVPSPRPPTVSHPPALKVHTYSRKREAGGVVPCPRKYDHSSIL